MYSWVPNRGMIMKTTRFFLEHIREQTRYLIDTTAGMSKDEFLSDQTFILAFERSLEIIGEAVGKIDKPFKTAHPHLPWSKIRGLRNIVTHMYWAVDYDIIWHVVTSEIPVLNSQIEALLASL